MLYVRAWLMIGLLVVSSWVPADESRRQDVFYGIVAFPPLSIIDPNTSSCTGIAIDKLKAILEKKRLTLGGICAPAARVYKLIDAGEVDLTINVKSTEALKDSVNFFPVPFVTLTLVLVTNPSVDNNFVAAIRGFDYHGYRDQLSYDGLQLLDVPSANDATHLFMRGRTKYLITYLRPFNEFVLSSSVKPTPDATIEKLIDIDTFVGISRYSKRQGLIYEALQAYIDESGAKMFIEN